MPFASLVFTCPLFAKVTEKKMNWKWVNSPLRLLLCALWLAKLFHVTNHEPQPDSLNGKVHEDSWFVRPYELHTDALPWSRRTKYVKWWCKWFGYTVNGSTTFADILDLRFPNTVWHREEYVWLCKDTLYWIRLLVYLCQYYRLGQKFSRFLAPFPTALKLDWIWDWSQNTYSPPAPWPLPTKLVFMPSGQYA